MRTAWHGESNISSWEVWTEVRKRWKYGICLLICLLMLLVGVVFNGEALFLASDDSSFIDGQVIKVDGGFEA